MAKENFTQSPDAPDQAALDAHKLGLQLDHLELHAESAIALLQLFAQQVPAGYPADDMSALKICALAELAVKILRAACDAKTVSAYTTAGEKVHALLGGIEEDMGQASQETAALLFGLTWAIEAFLRANGLLPGDALIASPAASSQAVATSEDDCEARCALALRASWEVEGLATLLHDQIADDAHGLPQRSMLRRVRRLSSVIMSALDDDLDDIASIEARFTETA